MSASSDVIVAGAGPAGTVAAFQLARAGARVTLIDRLRPGPARIGEVLPGAACRILAILGLEETLQPETGAVRARVGGRLFAWGSEIPVADDAFADPYGPGQRLDRLQFDRYLRMRAIEVGVEFRGANVLSVERVDGGWNCLIEDSSRIRGRWLIDATGRKAHVGGLVGARRQRGAPLVALYGIVVPSANVDLDRTVIEAQPDGWFYAGSLGRNRWALGFHTSPREAALIRRTPQILKEMILKAPTLSSLFGAFEFEGPIAVRDARGAWMAPCVGSSWIACGDAALSFDPLAGQGLFNALRTGMAAADEIQRSASGKIATTYEDELNKVATIYLQRRRELYGAGSRWGDQPFWRVQRSWGES